MSAVANSEGGALMALQQWFLSALVQPEHTPRNAVNQMLLPGAKLSPAACLAIYQRSYLMRLRMCLGEQFPATRHALGQPLFDDFAEAYLRECPSDSYTLYELGRRFSNWLSQTRPDQDLPDSEREDWIDFMIELADYEYQLYRLFDAPGHEGQIWPDPNTDDSELVLQPCLILATYQFPVAWYYHEVRDQRSPEFPDHEPSHLVLLRKEHRTATYPVTPVHYHFLNALRQEQSIEGALQAVSTFSDRPLAIVRESWTNEVRQVWIDAGFFVRRGICE